MQSSAKFRVAYVLPQLNRAGAQKQVIALASGMADRGHPVRLIMLEEGRGMADQLSDRVEVRCCQMAEKPRSFANVAGFVRLFWFLRSFRPEVIHTYLYWPNVWGALAALFIPSAILITSRRNLAWYKETNVWLERLEDFSNLRASVVVTNSISGKVDTERWEPRARGRIRVIYNGIKPRVWDGVTNGKPSASEVELTRTKHNASPEDTVLVSVANLHHYKGHFDLLAAASLLKDKGRRFVLWIVGEDRGYEAAIRPEIARLGLEKHAFLLGRSDDVETLLGAADIGLLCPSHNEGLSNSLLEYMNWGLPAVVTDVGGNPECVSNGENGLVVPGGRPDLLADCIDRLIESPSMRTTFGNESEARVRRIFDIDRLIDEHEQLYGEFTRQ